MSGLSAQVSRPLALAPALLARWDALNAAVPALYSPFLSAGYARAAQAAGMDVRVAVLQRDGQPCGFFPFQFPGPLAAWLRSAEPVGGGMTDYVGLVAEAGLRVEPARLLRLAGLNNFDFSHLDQSQAEFGLAGEQPRVGLRIRLERDAALPLAALLADKHKYRKDSERRARQLEKELGPLAFTLDQTARRGELLDELVAHKRAQYRRTGARDVLDQPARLRLLHALRGCDGAACRGLLSTLSAGDQWVAMHFGLAGNGVLQYWLPVYNPALSKYAPGRLLIHHIIEASREAGIDTIDRGEGDTSSKRELANEEHQFYRGAWHNRSAASHLARGFQSIKWRLGA